MNLKRTFRDAFIMISFCGTFYVSTFMWGKVDPKPPSDSNFSRSRVVADDFISSHRWELAAVQYKRMTEDDPYNGYAWYRLGTSYNNVRFESQNQIRVEQESVLPSTQNIKRLQELIAKHGKLALDAHGTAKKFLRYRSKSLFQMAVIYADLADYEASLECLREFVEGGYGTFRGLDSVERLGGGGRSMVDQEVLANSRTRLHSFQEFWELVDEERRSQSSKEARRRSKKSR